MKCKRPILNGRCREGIWLTQRQVSTAFIIAASAWLLPVTAAPTDSSVPHHKVNTVLEHLDRQGKVNWKSVDTGRVTTLTAEELSAGCFNYKSRAGIKRWNDWASAGQIAGYAVRSACVGSGERIQASNVEQFIPNACDTLLKVVPEVQAANDAWYFYQTTSQNLDGVKDWINFRFQYLSDSAPSLTQEICSLAFDQITNYICVESDDGSTDGATLEIGGDDGMYIGFDPNSDDSEH